MDQFEEQVERAKRGDGKAFQGLVEPLLPALTAYVRLRMDDRLARRESAADVVQSVCGDLLQDLPGLNAKNEGGFRAWMFSAVTNKLANKAAHHRAAKRDLSRDQDLGFGSRVTDRAILLSHRSVLSPSQDLSNREELERVESAFDELPADYRDVLLHVAVAGLSYRETAEVMGKSADAIKQLAVRARARLATLLD